MVTQKGKAHISPPYLRLGLRNYFMNFYVLYSVVEISRSANQQIGYLANIAGA